MSWNCTITTDGQVEGWETRSFWSDKPEWGGNWSALLSNILPSVSGVQVTPESALTLTAALACINVIATDFASLPLKVYRRRKSGGSDEVRDTALWERLAVSPDGETTPMRSQQALMGHVCGWGNGYYEIEWTNAGEIAGLHLLDPRTRAERRTQDKKLFYRLPDGGTLPPWKVFHLAGLGFDGLSGYSPVRLMRDAIGLGKAAELFGASFYGNNSMPGGLIEMAGKLSDDAQHRFRRDWEAMHRGPTNSHRIAFLEQGWKFHAMTISPEDAQFLEGRKFQVLEVARIYRVPPNKIGDWSQSHLANVEAANLDYVITVLAPWCEQYEQMANLRLLTSEDRARGVFVEHVMTALLRGDMKSRAEFYTKLRDLGVLSVNDILELENRNPIGTSGDVRLVPLNMVPLDRVGKTQAETQEPAPAPADVEPVDEDKTDGRATILNGRAAH